MAKFKIEKIFVFGSNLLGIHKKGAALFALQNHGAILGQGIGFQGTSYAIPTKRTPYETLPLEQINKFVADFINWTSFTPEYEYHVTPIGCGLAGYEPRDIAPMFYYAQGLDNVILPEQFTSILKNSLNFSIT